MENIFDILDYVNDNDVRFIRFLFTDLYGRNHNISVSIDDLQRALEEGLLFKSIPIDGYKNKEETDLLLVPDLTTFSTLPWRPQQGSVARLICNVANPDKTPLDVDSRQILINILNYAKSIGLEFEIGAKIEFYLFDLDENNKPSRNPVDDAGFYDIGPLDKGENTRREIILTLEEMGFSILNSYHEEGPGQHQIDFRMSDPLTCADNIQTFKYVVKTIAQRNGMHASFMPKPLNNQPGSGMHIMITAYQGDHNIFTGKDGSYSKDAEYFSGGILKDFSAITAFANPIVNSYKRLASSFNLENLKWNPKSKDSIIRIPNNLNNSTYLIFRTPDAAANPYLLFALLIGSGLNGIKNKVDPSDIVIDLSNSLINSVNALKESPDILQIIPQELIEEFSDDKHSEWENYINTVHDWEIEKYFNLI